MSFENRERKKYFKSCVKIAREALITMSILWGQIELDEEVFDGYPSSESFDEVVMNFIFWIEKWNF